MDQVWKQPSLVGEQILLESEVEDAKSLQLLFW